jgi:hypothetical protein
MAAMAASSTLSPGRQDVEPAQAERGQLREMLERGHKGQRHTAVRQQQVAEAGKRSYRRGMAARSPRML